MKSIKIVCDTKNTADTFAYKMNMHAKRDSLSFVVEAITSDQIEQNIKVTDILILSPQLKYLRSILSERNNDMYVYVIPKKDYVSFDSEKILGSAIRLYTDKMTLSDSINEPRYINYLQV